MAIGQISYQNQSTGNLEAQTGISGSANMINTARSTASRLSETRQSSNRRNVAG